MAPVGYTDAGSVSVAGNRRPGAVHENAGSLGKPAFVIHGCAILAVDFDRARARVLTARQRYGEHAVAIGGLHLRRIHRGRYGEAPTEGPITALHAVVLLALGRGLELALAGDGEHVVLERNRDLLALHPRE